MMNTEKKALKNKRNSKGSNMVICNTRVTINSRKAAPMILDKRNSTALVL